LAFNGLTSRRTRIESEPFFAITLSIISHLSIDILASSKDTLVFRARSSPVALEANTLALRSHLSELSCANGGSTGVGILRELLESRQAIAHSILISHLILSRALLRNTLNLASILSVSRFAASCSEFIKHSVLINNSVLASCLSLEHLPTLFAHALALIIADSVGVRAVHWQTIRVLRIRSESLEAPAHSVGVSCSVLSIASNANAQAFGVRIKLEAFLAHTNSSSVSHSILVWAISWMTHTISEFCESTLANANSQRILLFIGSRANCRFTKSVAFVNLESSFTNAFASHIRNSIAVLTFGGQASSVGLELLESVLAKTDSVIVSHSIGVRASNLLALTIGLVFSVTINTHALSVLIESSVRISANRVHAFLDLLNEFKSWLAHTGPSFISDHGVLIWARLLLASSGFLIQIKVLVAIALSSVKVSVGIWVRTLKLHTLGLISPHISETL
jgi:hypothetical protein